MRKKESGRYSVELRTILNEISKTINILTSEKKKKCRFYFRNSEQYYIPCIKQCERDKNCIATWEKTRVGKPARNIYIYRSRNKINGEKKEKRGTENEEEQKVKRNGETGVLVTRIKKKREKKKRKKEEKKKKENHKKIEASTDVFIVTMSFQQRSITLFPPLVTLIDTPSARRGINETHLHGNILTPWQG